MAANQNTTYIALFHHRDHAASAIQELRRVGVAPNSLTVIGGGNGASYSDAQGTFGEGYGYGVRSGLEDVGVPDRDRAHLEDGLASGGTVLILTEADARAGEIETIFEKHSTKKIDETNVINRGDTAPIAAAAVPVDSIESTVIPVTQEELVVGKREVEREGVRVFRRVVEQPVSEAVNLREERVVIDRQPVNRAATEADLLSGDRTIELRETAEEAVIGKNARVVEEVRVGKQATDHIETVHDTVRRTEIDVEQFGTADETLTRKNS